MNCAERGMLRATTQNHRTLTSSSFSKTGKLCSITWIWLVSKNAILRFYTILIETDKKSFHFLFCKTNNKNYSKTIIWPSLLVYLQRHKMSACLISVLVEIEKKLFYIWKKSKIFFDPKNRVWPRGFRIWSHWPRFSHWPQY